MTEITMWARTGEDSPIIKDFKRRGGGVKLTTSAGQEAFVLTLPAGWHVYQGGSRHWTNHKILDAQGKEVGALTVGDPGLTKLLYQHLILD